MAYTCELIARMRLSLVKSLQENVRFACMSARTTRSNQPTIP